MNLIPPTTGLLQNVPAEGLANLGTALRSASPTVPTENVYRHLRVLLAEPTAAPQQRRRGLKGLLTTVGGAIGGAGLLGDVSPEAQHSAAQQGLFNFGTNMLRASGDTAFLPALGESLQAGRAGGLAAADHVTQLKQVASQLALRQRLAAKYALPVGASPQEHVLALHSLYQEFLRVGDVEAARALGEVLKSTTDLLKPAKEPNAPNQQKADFMLDGKHVQGAFDPESGQYLYQGQPAPNAQPYVAPRQNDEAGERSDRSYIMSEWRRTMTGEPERAAVLDAADAAYREAVRSGSPTAQTALTRAIAAMFNKGALSDSDVESFAQAPGFVGVLTNIRNGVLSERLSPQQMQAFGQMLQAVRDGHSSRVEAIANDFRQEAAELGQPSLRFRNPYTIGRERKAPAGPTPGERLLTSPTPAPRPMTDDEIIAAARARRR